MLLATLRLVAGAVQQTPPRPDRPNVLMIVMDDLRPMFPAFGYEGVSAPHMSRLAAHGLAFWLCARCALSAQQWNRQGRKAPGVFIPRHVILK